MKTETGHAAGFILSRGNGNISMENITVAVGEVLKAGQVVGLIATGSFAGSYAAINPAESDGREAAKGVLLDDADASVAEVAAAIVARDAEVNGNELVWPDAISAGDKAAAIVQLVALGIIVR